MILFEEFLTDPAALARSEEFWLELLTPIAVSREWTQPWFPKMSGTSLRDGNAIFTSLHPLSRKGFLLNQRSAEEKWDPFSAWTDVWDPDYNPVDVVHVHTILAVSIIPRVVHLFELWSDPTMTRSEMDAILDKSEKADWPADWYDRFSRRASR